MEWSRDATVPVLFILNPDSCVATPLARISRSLRLRRTAIDFAFVLRLRLELGTRLCPSYVIFEPDFYVTPALAAAFATPPEILGRDIAAPSPGCPF